MMRDMKYTPHVPGVVLVPILAALIGCQQPKPISGQMQVQLPDEQAYLQFWSHALSAVRHFGYEIDRADPAAGVLVTRPVTSKQWFEFWRIDTLGSDQVAEASLHTIRRQIQVRIQRSGANSDEYAIGVQANVQRYSQTERQVTTASSAAQAFAGKLPLVEQPASPAEAEPHWVDLGRDPTLESAVLRQIGKYPGVKIVTPSENAEAGEPSTQPVGNGE